MIFGRPDPNAAPAGSDAGLSLAAGGSDHADFHADPTAGSLAVRVLEARTLVMGDTNGDGNADFVLTLIGRHSLDEEAFVL